MFILHALSMAFAMFWEILWALILGFALSGVVQAVVSKREMIRLLPDDSPRTLVVACGLGAASSSCSYAAVALARSLFRKGANFTASIAFELASTNLVAELGIIMVVLLGWSFLFAELIGAPIMIVVVVWLFRRFLTAEMVDTAKRQVDKGIAGSMEGHADMDMSVHDHGSIWSRITSAKGFTAHQPLLRHGLGGSVARHCRRLADCRCAGGMGAQDVLDGLLSGEASDVRAPVGSAGRTAGCHGVVRLLRGQRATRRCPVLWNGGISFGGVIAFIFADLIVVPILDIYRRYYTARIAWFLTWTLFVAMALAGLAVEVLFKALNAVPQDRNALVPEAHVALNYTTVLNVLFLALAAVLTWRAARTGGFQMVRIMNAPAPAHNHR